ncbi:L-threonylcarbamoyladenylate synthase [Sanyastnella coralliicola]|uniref:L-threonylcarbamoyladenylate synthase n=1 Tax=Sanyastnella coralliicola TaxID=3069118 RepID=UPI0027B9FF74|nr:L-threonylcarbamoyladenylate synthase [Longitalea sp. SCSIO 12813]
MLVQIHPENPDPRKVRQVVECLLDGGVIIYPTDSVYAIGCDLSRVRSVERVAKIKGVSMKESNFSLVCRDLSHLSEYTKPVENNIYKLMKRALPGPYTFILNANTNVPKIFKTKRKEIGIRVPDNEIALALVSALGNPLVATSVHDDDEIIEYTTDPELIHERYEKTVDMVVAGGMGNIEASTVFNCTSGQPELVRLGIGAIEGLL